MNTFPEHLIIGAGATGWSVASYLKCQKIPYRVVDSRVHPPFETQFRDALNEDEMHFGDFETDWFDKHSVLVVSPGVSAQAEPIQRARAGGAEIISDIELFARASKKPYVAITGSNGKSTVTAMVEKVLVDCGRRAIAGGNYGLPALDLLAENDIDCYVLELSSFQLETTYSLQASVAVLMNVTDDHLDRHQSYECYRDIKKSIFNGATYAVVNRDQADLLAVKGDKGIVTFGLSKPEDQQFGTRVEGHEVWLAKGTQKLMRKTALKVAGEHNVQNALATLAVADLMQLDLTKAVESLADFGGLPFRCELIAEFDGVRWYNDSKGTNIGATQAAIGGLPAGQILICGGVFKGGSLEQFRQSVIEKVDHVFAFGKDRDVFVEVLGECVATETVNDLSAAVVAAKQIAQPGECVLFSPACASFDMFDNYIHRGNEFNRLVRNLLATARAS